MQYKVPNLMFSKSDMGTSWESTGKLTLMLSADRNQVVHWWIRTSLGYGSPISINQAILKIHSLKISSLIKLYSQ